MLEPFFKKDAVWHGCSPVNLLHNSIKAFYKNTSEGMLLNN